jgi:microcystin-dependent protein
MTDFKSDSIDAVSTYSYIPTGGIVSLAGPFSKYSDSSYITLGLIPCDGRTLNASTNPQYQALFNVIGNIYGGTNNTNFLVPNLTSNKVSIVGTSSTFYNTNTVGTKLISYNHGHSVSMSNNTFSMNAANVTHDHNYNFNTVGNIVQNSHSHGTNSPAAAMGASQKNGPAGTAGGGLLGNHIHNYSVNANIHNLVGGADHTHSDAGINGNSGNAGDASHTHASSATSSANSGNLTIDGTSSFPIGVPYANMLYFIKA